MTRAGTERPVLCLVYADGHVIALSNAPATDKRIRDDFKVMCKMGITGYRLTRLVLDEAVPLYAVGLGCPACRIAFPCGCSPESVLAGGCAHGKTEAVHKAAVAAGVPQDGSA